LKPIVVNESNNDYYLKLLRNKLQIDDSNDISIKNFELQTKPYIDFELIFTNPIVPLENMILNFEEIVPKRIVDEDRKGSIKSLVDFNKLLQNYM